MEDLKKTFAGKLLNIKAIKLQPNDPFTWASGWKSPFYCDNRKTLSYHDVRSFVKLELVHAILSHFPTATAVAGVATGAIAQGALVAEELALPYAYVRPKPKDHGMKNQIEGQLPEGAKVVVVEDLISTGGSSLKAVAALREAGFEVVGMVASYTYGPLLGLFAFGLYTQWEIRDRYVPVVVIVAPIATALLDHYAPIWWGYTFGYELLILNGGLTALGLFALRRFKK